METFRVVAKYRIQATFVAPTDHWATLLFKSFFSLHTEMLHLDFFIRNRNRESTVLCCNFSWFISSYSCVYPALQKLWIFRNTFPSTSVSSPSVDPSREAWTHRVRLMSDRSAQPIRSPSASASLPPHGSRGRAGRLPKRGVRVGVNGWRREAGASMSGTGALDQHSWAGIGHTAGSGLHSSTKQDCEKRGK